MRKPKFCGLWKQTADGWTRTCNLGEFKLVLKVERGVVATLSIPDTGTVYGRKRYDSTREAKQSLDRMIRGAIKMHRL